MDRSKSTRFLAVVLCLAMIIGVLPVVSFAADSVLSLTIASTKTSALAPGVQEQEIVAYDVNGDRIVYYAITADVATNPDVQVKANYHDNDNTGVWGKATVVEQANAATEKRGYNVVASTNASYYNVSTGQPTGGFVMEGVNINGDSMGNSYPFFAILKDGTAMIGQKGTFSQYSANIQEAVGGWTMLVWDGQIVATNNTNKYPRSTVGVKANGDVVLMVADGNQKPYSAGLTLVEQAEVMLSLGCVAAVELDGGGSATYAAKLEGTDEVVVRNSCCDGTVRSVSNTLMVISTAVADGTFDHANLSTEYVFYAANSKVAIDATGADKSGYPAEIPENATWALSDDSFGTIADGVFTSNGKIGTVTASMLVDGTAVGSIEINVVHPTEIAFGAEEKTIPFGKPSDFTVTALYNGADMYTAADAYDFVCTAGSMDGFIYTAPQEGVATSATVTATYKYDSTVASDSIAVTFGKGSDLLFDFEDGIDGWGTYFDLVDAAQKGEYTGGYTVAYESEGSSAGNLVELGIHENVFLATKENGGQVYSGDNALGYTLDYRYSTAHANWQYAYLYFWGEPITLLDTDNGINGTRLGMWMYIPEEAVGSCARFCYTYERADGVLNTAYLYLTYQYVEKGFSKLTSDKIPEAGWAYVYVDMKQISDTYVSTSYYKDETGFSTRKDNKGNGSGEDYTSNYAPGFIQFIISSSAVGAEKVTFYIDDITLDYSDAVDDRDMPIISDPLVLDDLNSYAINGNTIAFNEISVTASAVEDTSRGSNYTGLNENTAQVYVDGQKVPTQFAAGKISASGIKLADGVHDITFEIADKQGNYTKLTRQVNVQAGTDYPSLTLTGKPVGVKQDGKLYTGGQYDICLTTDKVEAIDNVEFQLWLNSASQWALEEMTVLPGFEATYVLDELACMATIKVQRVDSDATGDATLVTIPVYAWSWNEELGQSTAKDQWSKTGCAPQVTVSYKVKYGTVGYTEEYQVDDTKYFAGFSNVRVDAKTELDSSIANLKKTIGEWHYHTEVAVDDVAATCTTTGHTGRTACSVCNSILTWGTTEATGHSYELTDGVLVCHCGDLFNGVYTDGKTYADGVALAGWVGESWYVDGVAQTGVQLIDGVYYDLGTDGISLGVYTGLLTVDGYTYYSVAGSLVSGWHGIGDDWYYFDETTYQGFDGERSSADCHVAYGFTYIFEDGRVTAPVWREVDGGLRCYYGPNFHKNGWKTIEGKEYYFSKSGFAYRGYQFLSSRYSDYLQWYYFDEVTGESYGETTETRFVTVDGNIYFMENGISTYKGLFEYEGGYYYVNSKYIVVTGNYKISKTNDLMAAGYYDFDENGKMIIEVKNGLVQEADGLYYYVDGELTYAGLIYDETEGCYYYIRSNCKAATGVYHVYWDKTNGLLPAGDYDFGEDGKLFIEEDEEEVKNGFVYENGDYYYYVDGELTYAGLIYDETEGCYYYVRSNYKMAKGVYHVYWDRTNGLLPAGDYDFGEDGKLFIEEEKEEEEVKNGFVYENGDYYYYVDGELTYAGLIYDETEGCYYYVRSNYKMAKGVYHVYWDRTNGLLPAGDYDFGEDGKLFID